jgi:hypothetical protein
MDSTLGVTSITTQGRVQLLTRRLRCFFQR